MTSSHRTPAGVPSSETRYRLGEALCLEVTDTGVGMDEATLGRATGPFFTTKGTGKGTGLGLPMVHGLAAQSGGQLILSSHPGRGTTAAVCLPIAAADDHAEPVEPDPQPHGGSTVSPRAILLVDDDALVLDSAASLLEDDGHTVLRAGSGEEALRLLAAGSHIDLVITDYAMPRMSGTEFVAQLAKLGHHLPVVLASGFAEAGDVGPDLVQLNKPYNQDELRVAVEQALRMKQILS